MSDEIKPRVTKIVMYMTPRRPKPREGDEKTVKGVTYVRKQVTEKDGAGRIRGYRVSHGRPVFEWVKKPLDSVQKP